MTDYTDIIFRLEKADGPSRELDAAIAGLQGVKVRCAFARSDDPIYIDTEKGRGIDAYTASLDAAISLTERHGFSWTIESGWQGGGPQASVATSAPHRFWQAYRSGLDKHFASPAIALLIATFRALQAQDSEDK